MSQRHLGGSRESQLGEVGQSGAEAEGQVGGAQAAPGEAEGAEAGGHVFVSSQHGKGEQKYSPSRSE